MQVAAAVGRHLHVEGAGEAERPEFLAPGEPHLVFAIAAGHADGQLVLTLAVERPFMLADDLFDQIQGIETAGGLDFSQSPHVLALPLCDRPVLGEWPGWNGSDGVYPDGIAPGQDDRSEEHTSELQSLMRISYAV